MTPNQLRALELQESKRHNLEQEDISRAQNKVAKYQAKTARRKAIADTIVNAVGNFIPSTSIRFSKALGSKRSATDYVAPATKSRVKPKYYKNREVTD